MLCLLVFIVHEGGVKVASGWKWDVTDKRWILRVRVSKTEVHHAQPWNDSQPIDIKHINWAYPSIFTSSYHNLTKHVSDQHVKTQQFLKSTKKSHTISQSNHLKNPSVILPLFQNSNMINTPKDTLQVEEAEGDEVGTMSINEARCWPQELRGWFLCGWMVGGAGGSRGKRFKGGPWWSWSNKKKLGGGFTQIFFGVSWSNLTSIFFGWVGSTTN